MRLEGSGTTKLTEVIKAVGHNNDYTFETARVIEPFPDIVVRIAGSGGRLDLDKDDLIINSSLRDFPVTLEAPDGTETTYIRKSPIKEGDAVLLLTDKRKASGTMFFLVSKVEKNRTT